MQPVPSQTPAVHARQRPPPCRGPLVVASTQKGCALAHMQRWRAGSCGSGAVIGPSPVRCCASILARRLRSAGAASAPAHGAARPAHDAAALPRAHGAAPGSAAAHGAARRQRSAAASAAAAAPSSTHAWETSPSWDDGPSSPYDLPRKPPVPLPPPPKGHKLTDIIPFLWDLALGETQLVWRIVLAVVLMFTSKLAGLACPLFIKHAVDILTAAAMGLDPPVWAATVSLPFVSTSLNAAMQAALVMVMCFGVCDMVKHVCKEAQTPTFLPVTQAIARRVSYHVFKHMLGLDVGFHLEKRTGRVSRILERGPRSFQYIYRAAIFVFLPTILELVAVTAVLARSFNPVVGGMVAATFLAYIAWSITMTQLATAVRKEVIELDNLTTSKAVDALLNFETVTLFNNQALEVKQYDRYIKQYQSASGRTERLGAMLNGGQAIILALGMSSVMLTAVLLGRGPGGNATPGDLVMIQGLLLQLWAPLQFLGWLYRELKNSVVDIEEFVDIMATQSRIKDGTVVLPELAPSLAAGHRFAVKHAEADAGGSGNGNSSNAARAAADGVSNGHVAGATSTAAAAAGVEIELDNVTFAYSEGRQILRGLSLRVEPGESVAIVGPSGSGKSTILKLLTRQYDVTSGSVKLNGVEISDLTLESLRAAVAVVPQEAVLFNGTIMQNIRYGRPEASDAEVLQSADMAHLDMGLVMKPRSVGERGLKLSGGEKQRVAIARAFLRAPRLLICDEATSALDSETEQQIIKSLDELALGRTSIFVAHRLSTIKGCDKIVVCKNGLVAEVGSHAQLMEAGGLYRAMWERQAAEELAEHHEDGSQLDRVDVTSSVEDPDAVMSDLALRTRAAI